MADDLEAFLRQAAQRRAQRQKPAAPKPIPTAPQSPPRQAPVAPTPVRRLVEVVDAVVVPAASSPLAPTRVDTSQFERRAEQLGEEVGLADEAMEAHLHQRFDHQVGSFSEGGLSSVDTSAPAEQLRESGSSFAQEIAAMLRDPLSVRRAIVLGDILNPPTHRW